MADTLVRDAIGEWWIYPTVSPTPTGIAFGAIASDGTILACAVNDDGSSSRIPVGVANANDHCAPALWVKEGHRSLILWAQHGSDPYLHCKVSDESGSLESLASATDQFATGRSTLTYVQIHHVEHLSSEENDFFWIFTRETTLAWSWISMSVNRASGVVSWTLSQPFMQSSQQCYISSAPSHDGKLRLAWGYNPAGPLSSIRYVEIDLKTGDVTSPMDRSVRSNLLTGEGLPLQEEEIAPLVGEPEAGYTRRLFYVRPGPSNRAVAYADWLISDPDNAVYKVRQQADDGTWSTREYGVAGPRVGYNASANYISGMSFPDPCPGEQLALARRASGASTVEWWEGENSDVRAFSSDQHVVRPLHTRDRMGELVVFHVYKYNTYTDYAAFARRIPLARAVDSSLSGGTGTSIW